MKSGNVGKYQQEKFAKKQQTELKYVIIVESLLFRNHKEKVMQCWIKFISVA